MALGLAGVPSGYGGTFTGKTVAESITKLSLIGAPQGRFKQSYKNPSVVVGSDPKTRLGLLGVSRGQLGNFNKALVPTTEYEYDTGATITLTPISYTVARDQVIDYVGLEIGSTTFDYDIIQGGQLLSYNTDTITITPNNYDIDQEITGSQYVTYTPASISVTPLSYTVAQERAVTYTPQTVSLVALPYEIIPGVLGEQGLSQADILAIWRGIKIDGMTPYDIMKYMAAVILGKVEGGNTTLETFKAPATGVVRYKSSVDSNGNRQTIELL